MRNYGIIFSIKSSLLEKQKIEEIYQNTFYILLKHKFKNNNNAKSYLEKETRIYLSLRAFGNTYKMCACVTSDSNL